MFCKQDAKPINLSLFSHEQLVETSSLCTYFIIRPTHKYFSIKKRNTLEKCFGLELFACHFECITTDLLMGRF